MSPAIVLTSTENKTRETRKTFFTVSVTVNTFAVNIFSYTLVI